MTKRLKKKGLGAPVAKPLYCPINNLNQAKRNPSSPEHIHGCDVWDLDQKLDMKPGLLALFAAELTPQLTLLDV